MQKRSAAGSRKRKRGSAVAEAPKLRAAFAAKVCPRCNRARNRDRVASKCILLRGLYEEVGLGTHPLLQRASPAEMAVRQFRDELSAVAQQFSKLNSAHAKLNKELSGLAREQRALQKQQTAGDKQLRADIRDIDTERRELQKEGPLTAAQQHTLDSARHMAEAVHTVQTAPIQPQLQVLAAQQAEVKSRSVPLTAQHGPLMDAVCLVGQHPLLNPLSQESHAVAGTLASGLLEDQRARWLRLSTRWGQSTWLYGDFALPKPKPKRKAKVGTVSYAAAERTHSHSYSLTYAACGRKHIRDECLCCACVGWCTG